MEDSMTNEQRIAALEQKAGQYDTAIITIAGTIKSINGILERLIADYAERTGRQ